MVSVANLKSYTKKILSMSEEKGVKSAIDYLVGQRQTWPLHLFECDIYFMFFIKKGDYKAESLRALKGGSHVKNPHIKLWSIPLRRIRYPYRDETSSYTGFI